MPRFDALYHGGAPGFAKGQLIMPHETKHLDGCPVCQARADENHAPDRVFASPERLYAKHFASKWGRGTLYQVEPVGEALLSEADSIPSIQAPAMRVLRVIQRGVVLTQAERRALYRLWAAADAARGFHQLITPAEQAQERELRRMIGIRPDEVLV